MKFFLTGVATLALLGWGTTTIAAPIIWDPAQNTSAVTDVVTSGSLVEAVNASDSTTGSVQLNTVPFDNRNNLLGNSFADALDGATSSNSDYDSFLNTFNFGGGSSTSITVADGLLSEGAPYLIQVWYTDLRGASSDRIMTFVGGSGVDRVDLSASAGFLGQFAIGRFTATSTGQTLMLETSGFPNAHITGYQVRQVPEPGVLLLMGVGLLALGLVGFRKRQAI